MKRIIAISKDKIVVVEVDPESKEKFGETHEFGWKPETIDLVFSEIIKKYKAKNFRILISDDLSYVVRLTIPKETTKDKERDFIREELQQKIPETLGESDWDYKELSLEKDKGEGTEKDVIAFALVRSFFDSLNKAIDKTGLEVEAIESETIAKTRDANPIIGIALKQDLTGRDEDILNLKLNLSDQESEGKEEGIGEGNLPVVSGKKGIVVKIILALLIINLLIGILWVIKTFLWGKNFQTKPSVEVPTTVPTATEIPKVEITPEVTLDLSNYSLQVQNGSGTAGVADVVAQTLTSEGFKNIETSNADSYTYQKTEVGLKKSTPLKAFEIIERALNSDYEVVQSEENLAEDSTFDAVIIVGKKLE